jgi:hypothetical protein
MEREEIKTETRKFVKHNERRKAVSQQEDGDI